MNPTPAQRKPLVDPGAELDWAAQANLSSYQAVDLEVLDVRVGRKFRCAFTTAGGGSNMTAQVTCGAPPKTFDITPILHPGQLRYIDLPAAVPDLSDDVAWASYATVLQTPVANWNQVLDGSFYAKRVPLVGMLSWNGMLFVCGSSRNSQELQGSGPSLIKKQWSGLSVLDGTVSPNVAFDPANGVGREIYSAGTSPDAGNDPTYCIGQAPGFRAGVPEGSAITEIGLNFGIDGRFLFVANYCGDDAAGHLLSQGIHNMSNIDTSDRFLVPLYELLADWLDGTSTALLATMDDPDPKPVPDDGPLGPEVDRGWFTCPYDVDDRPDCSNVGGSSDTTNTLKGNKLRSTVVFTVPENSTSVNAGKTFVVAVLNLDPIAFPWEYGDIDADHVPLDARDECGDLPSPSYKVHANGGRDDGKYDYLMIADITHMYSVETLPNPLVSPLPDDYWHHEDITEWREHVTFLRIPPDLPTGFDVDVVEEAVYGVQQLNSGHDFSLVEVYEGPGTPDSVNTPKVTVPIVGSGTLKSMAVKPDGRYLYLVASDQGQESVPENENLLDGGLHIPHLYVIDLHTFNLSDQKTLNDNSEAMIRSYRFNKVVGVEPEGGVVDPCECDPTNCTDPPFAYDKGATCINSTIPGFPTTMFPTGHNLTVPSASSSDGTVVVDAIGPTTLSGASTADVGGYYPGEHQGDPTARTRLQIIRNDSMNLPEQPGIASPVRLYVGSTGFSQDPNDWFQFGRQGAIFSLELDDIDGTPTYLSTLTIDQNFEPGGGGPDPLEHWAVSGLDFLPPGSYGGNQPRNVLVAIARHTRPITFIPVRDYIYLLEDW